MSVKWISLQKMPMRDQDTLSAPTAVLSGACADAFWAHVSIITFPTQWDLFFFLSEEVFCSCELSIPDWWEQWRRGALGLSPALSERWASRSRGRISLHVYARTHTHSRARTHLGYTLHGAPGCEAKPASARNRYQELAEPCMCVCAVSVCHCSLLLCLSVCIWVFMR